MIAKCERKVYSEVFIVTFFTFCVIFFCVLHLTIYLYLDRTYPLNLRYQTRQILYPGQVASYESSCDYALVTDFHFWLFLLLNFIFHFSIFVTIATETRISAQNAISQEVFNVRSRFCILLGGFHWKLWSIFFIRPRIEIELLRFFCNFFCGVISWLWFVNMVPFHVRS